MTKNRRILLASFLLVVASAMAVNAQSTDTVLKNPVKLPPTYPLPDLIVDEITFGNDTAPSNVRVHVRNQGKGTSAECYLAFMSAKPQTAGDTQQRVWTVKIPAIAAGKDAYIRFTVLPLKEADGQWRALVDRSNTVKESNENNNALTH